MSLLVCWSTTSEAAELKRFFKLNFPADRTSFNSMIDLFPSF